MEFALHEMYEISRLPMGELSYKEYAPGTEELHLMKKDTPECTRPTRRSCVTSTSAPQTTRLGAGGIKKMSRANYLLQGLGRSWAR